MKRYLLIVAVVLFPISGFSQDDCDEACRELLSDVREATAKYHEEIDALADGFRSMIHCSGAGALGAMGVHYVNQARTRGIAVDALQPEVLLYEPQKNGRMRLVGVEYFAPVLSNGRPWFGVENQPPPVIDNPPPVLFGQTFNGPMPGHEPGMPWHYDLHVWIWRHNPAGMFNIWNPRVSCE